MVHQRGNQREGSPHYVLLYSDDEHSGGEENIPLQSSNKSTLPRKVEVISVQLKSEDTLQALALRYRCTISELKRINKIHKENEVYARRFVKVPVQPFSILTETLERNQSSQGTQSLVGIPTEEVPPSTSATDLTEDSMKRLVITEAPKMEINSIILNSVCEPLSSYNNSNSLEISSAEYDQLLSSTESNATNSHLTDAFKCSGDDCGLSWTQVLGFSLLLGFAGPIIYILYIAEFSSKSHSTVNH